MNPTPQGEQPETEAPAPQRRFDRSRLAGLVLVVASALVIAMLVLGGSSPRHASSASTTVVAPPTTTPTTVPVPTTTAPPVTTTTLQAVTTTTIYHPPVTTTTAPYHPPVTTTTAPAHPANWTGTEPPSLLGHHPATIVAYGVRDCNPNGPTWTVWFKYSFGYTYVVTRSVIAGTGDYMFFSDEDGNRVPGQYLGKIYSSAPGASNGCYLGSTQIG